MSSSIVPDGDEQVPASSEAEELEERPAEESGVSEDGASASSDTGEIVGEDAKAELPGVDETDTGLVEETVQVPDTEESESEDAIAEEVESGTPDVSEALAGLGQELSESMGRMLKAFDDKLAYDGVKDDQISRLHEELQEYKRDLLGRVTRPYVIGLVRLHDDFGKVLQALRSREQEQMPLVEVCEILKGFQEDLGILLADNDVTIFVEPDGTFNPARQTCSRTEPSPSAELVKQVAGKLRPGFEQDGKVVQKERVVVYSAPSKEEAPEAEPVDEASREARRIWLWIRRIFTG